MGTENQSARLKLSECEFEESDIVGCSPVRSYCIPLNSTFRKCKVFNLVISIGDLGMWKKACVDCMGVLFVREKAEDLPSDPKISQLRETGTQFLSRSMLLSVLPKNAKDVLGTLDLLAGTMESSDLTRMKDLATAAEASARDGRTPADEFRRRRRSSGRKEAL